jgi:hypothetical protein
MMSVDSFAYHWIRGRKLTTPSRLSPAHDPPASSDAFQSKLCVLTFAFPPQNNRVTANEREFIVPSNRLRPGSKLAQIHNANQ